MNYDCNEQQNELRTKYAALNDSVLGPHFKEAGMASVDGTKAFIVSRMEKLAEFGLLGLGHESMYGGEPCDEIGKAIAYEALAKTCSSTYLSAATSSILFGMPIALFGNASQKKNYLPDIIAGEKIGCCALYEAGAGSDYSAMTTVAEKKKDRWLLNGKKTCITNAPIADACIVMAYTDAGAGVEKGVTFFIVESGTPGFTQGTNIEMLGFSGSPIGAIILEDCELPDEAVLGSVNEGFRIMQTVIDYGRIVAATGSLGIAMAAFEEANRYSKIRKSFGRYINRYQEVAFKLADMMMLTDLSRLIIYRALWAFDQKDREASTLVSCAKLFASESGTLCANHALQIHGSAGYMNDAKVAQLYRDAKLGEIIFGTSEIQRVSIARSVLEKFGGHWSAPD